MNIKQHTEPNLIIQREKNVGHGSILSIGNWLDCEKWARNKTRPRCKFAVEFTRLHPSRKLVLRLFYYISFIAVTDTNVLEIMIKLINNNFDFKEKL